MSIANSIYHSQSIYNHFKQLKLGLFLSDVYLRHLMAIVVSFFLNGFRGKIADVAGIAACHRTTIAHFLNHGKWKDTNLRQTLKKNVIRTIY